MGLPLYRLALLLLLSVLEHGAVLQASTPESYTVPTGQPDLEDTSALTVSPTTVGATIAATDLIPTESSASPSTITSLPDSDSSETTEVPATQQPSTTTEAAIEETNPTTVSSTRTTPAADTTTSAPISATTVLPNSPSTPASTSAATVLPNSPSTPAPTSAATVLPNSPSTPAPTSAATVLPNGASTPAPTSAATVLPNSASTPAPTSAATVLPNSASTPAPTSAATVLPNSASTPAPTNATTALPTSSSSSAPINATTVLPTSASSPTPTSATAATINATTSVDNVTTASTPAPTTLPPKPNPTVGNYTLSPEPNASFCLMAMMGLQFSFKDGSMVQTVNLDPNDTKPTGSCGSNASSSTLLLTSDKITVQFVFTNQQNKFYLSALDLTINTETGKPLHVQRTNLSLWEASLGSSYMCQKEQSYNVTEDLLLSTFELQVQPFNVTDNKFSTAEECFLDIDLTFVVPIAVGVALGFLIVLVLIAYLIGRRKSRTGYQSV